MCIAHGLTIITADVREFERAPGLGVERWGDLDQGSRSPQNRRTMATGRGKKKRRKGSSQPRAGVRPASDAPPLDHLVQTVLSGGREIVDEDNPLLAESWASAMLGTFYKPPLPFEARQELEASIGPAIVRGAERRGDRTALAVLRALAAIADETLRPLAQTAADTLAAAGVAEPAWAAAIGHPTYLDCWMAADPFGDQQGYYLRFRYPGRATHLLMALYDENLGGIIKDAFVGEVAPGSDPRRSSEGQADVAVSDVDAGLAARRIADALATGDLFIDNDWSPDFRATRALLAARLALLPPAPARALEPEQLDDEARAALVEEFLGSPHAAAVDEARSIVYRCLEARCDYGDGDPLRWSPIVVELFMLDYLPRKALLRAGEVDVLPEVLTAWVRFALSKRGLAEHLVVETEDAVRDCTPEYLEAVREPANFGPAKAMLGALEAAGIDLTDQKAIDGWVAELNARPRHERDAIMGASPFRDDSDPAT